MDGGRIPSPVFAAGVPPRRWQPAAFLWACLAGAAFALVVWKLSSLEFRYALALAALVVAASLAMVLLPWLEDCLLYAFVFNIPFAGFAKWMFLREAITVAKGIAFGFTEVLLVVAYALWFCQIFVARTRPLPKLGAIDALFGVVFVAQCLSSLGAPLRDLALFDTLYNVKFFLVYFYFAHKLERRHVPIVILLLLFAILVEGPIAVFERVTGDVGIGRSKGDTAGVDFGSQYEVPGFEQIRAEGTTIDSHTLGLYLAMLLLVPLALFLVRGIATRWRIGLAGIALVGVAGLVVTFSRSAWICFFIASVVLAGIAIVQWGRGRPVVALALLFVAVSALYPDVYEYAIVRLLDAPSGIMDVRFQLNWTALGILRAHPLLGYGPGNFMEALRDPNVNDLAGAGLPVHNAFLWIASEAGLPAAFAFFAMIGVAMKRLVSYRADPDVLVRAFSVAMFLGLVVYVLDGLTNPTFREPSPYTMLWLYLAFSVALPRMMRMRQRIARPQRRFAAAAP
jgi:hypothetical protein